MLESYDSKDLYAILRKILVIVVKVEEGMHDMMRIITNSVVPHTHIQASHVFIVCTHVYICANSQKNVTLKLTCAVYIHTYIFLIYFLRVVSL